MRCPTCGFENLLGSDVCDNCGSDLAGRDVPEPATQFHGQLLGAHLDALRVATPEIVDASADVDEAIQRMHDKGIDCVLVVCDSPGCVAVADWLRSTGRTLPSTSFRTP